MTINPRTAVSLGTAVTLLFVVPISLPGGFFVLPKLTLTAAWLVVLITFFFLNRARYQFGLPLPVTVLLLAYLAWAALDNLTLSPYLNFTLLGWPNWYSGLCLTFLIAGVFGAASFLCRVNPTPLSSSLLLFFSLSIAIALISILERLGFQPLIGSSWFHIPDLATNLTVSLPIATVGNSGWLAGLWLLMLPLPFLRQVPPSLAPPWMLINAIGLASTQNKTSLILGSGTLLIIFLRNLYLRERRTRRSILIALVLTVSTSPLLTLGNQTLYGHGLVSHLVTLSSVDTSAGSSSLRSRVLIWKEALRLVAQRPVTGWGLDTLQMRFFNHMPDAEYRELISPVVGLKTEETVRHTGLLHMVFGPDQTLRRIQFFTLVRPHNALIEELYSNGIIGLLLLLALIGTCFTHVIRYGGATEKLLILACFLYGVYLLLWFTTVAVTPVAAALLGFAVSGTEARRLRALPSNLT